MSVLGGTKAAVGVRPPPWEARAERAARGERDPRWEFDADRAAAARQAKGPSEPQPRAAQPEAPTEVRAGVRGDGQEHDPREDTGMGQAGTARNARASLPGPQGPGGARAGAALGAGTPTPTATAPEDAGAAALAVAVAAVVRGGTAPGAARGGAESPAWGLAEGVGAAAEGAGAARAAAKTVQAAPGARFAEVLEALEGRDVGPGQRTLRLTDTAAGALTVQVAVAGGDLLVRVRAHDPARRGVVARTLAQARRVLEEARLVDGRVHVEQDVGQGPEGEPGVGGTAGERTRRDGRTRAGQQDGARRERDESGE